MIKKILLGLLVILVLIQFYPVDQSIPPHEKNQDFLTIADMDGQEEMVGLIRTACYDCHSYETEYPWYSSIMPVSKWLQGHIEHGRDKLNFSTWASLNLEDQKHALKECVEVLEETRMPLLSYMIMHNDAWINDEERAQMIDFFQEKRKSL